MLHGSFYVEEHAIEKPVKEHGDEPLFANDPWNQPM